jgi:hypothetical protein
MCQKEIEDAAAQLPRDLQELWRTPRGGPTSTPAPEPVVAPPRSAAVSPELTEWPGVAAEVEEAGALPASVRGIDAAAAVGYG